MSEFTRREVRRLKPELKNVLREAIRKHDVSGVIRWLQKYGNHLSLERQAQITAECKEILTGGDGERRR
jgi:hypothetical protein